MTSKILLGTTALAAILLSTGAQAADEGLKLKLGGFFQGYAMIGNVDRNDGVDNFRDVSFESWNSEVWFTAEAETASGLKYGFRIELEGASVGDQIDESYLWVSGSFGRVMFGNDDGVGNSLAYQIPTVTRSKSLRIEDQDYAPTANINGAHLLTGFNSPNHYALDASKLAYTTPRLSGFQLGVSYAPDLSEDPGTAAPGTAVAGGFETDNDNQAGDALEFGLNYNNKFGDLGLVASVTYYHDQLENGAAATSDDRQSIAAGAGIAYKGFSIGANYMWTDNYRSAGYGNAGRKGVDLNQFLVGAQYVTGPWSFGANAGWGVADGKSNAAAGNSEDKLFAGLVGVGYNVAPGIELEAGVQYYDWSSDLDAREADATVGLVGTTLSF